MKRPSYRSTKPWECYADTWDMLLVNLLGHILPRNQREEWLGDLKEARLSLLSNGWSRWIVAVITLLRLCLLLWSLLRIKYQDLGLCTTSETLETESFPMDMELIRLLAMSKSPVVMSDYRTVARERVALAIHLNGHRGREPFVALNCSGIPEDEIEKRLFGKRKWLCHRTGCLQQADNGTLFLDGVDTLPLHVQLKLLIFLLENTITPVGGSTDIHLNVRLIAAWTTDLMDCVKEGRFRADLYYRLNVNPLSENDLRKK
jgi:transcriptional regulator of acetoin/glycerol metabolism